MAPCTTTRVEPAAGPVVGQKLETWSWASYVNEVRSCVNCCPFNVISRFRGVRLIQASPAIETLSNHWLYTVVSVFADNANCQEGTG